MKILLSGAGVAGPALGYWLAHYGFEPTIIEKAPRLRTGGYIIDFWGAGFDTTERMGLLPELRAKGYLVREIRVVNERGKRVAGFAADVFARSTHGRYISLPRGKLSETIFARIDGKIEVIFGDSITELHQTGESVHVSFEHGRDRQFDLVIGADGLHSRVRELVFGPERQFEKYLGYRVATFTTEGYRPRDELAYVMYTEVGQQVARFAMRDDRTMFLFTFADEELQTPSIPNVQEQKALLRSRFGNSGWECPRILETLDASSDLYFDRVSQIRMEGVPGLWTRGRVALIGDAAWCVSLLAGQGSALAIVGAYILAGELYRSSDNYARAFSRYEELLAPFIQEKQQAALRFSGVFAPKSKLSLFVRNQVMNLFRIPGVAELALGTELRDKIALPEYERNRE